MRSLIVSISVASALAVTQAAHAQSSAAVVAVTAGSATDERGIRSDAITLAPSVVFAPGPNSSFVLGANATRFANTAWQLGAGATLAARSSQSAGFALALNAGASAAHASFDATFAQADATPSLQWSAGPLTLIGGVHVASGYAAVSTPSSTPVVPVGSQLVSQSRGSYAPSYGGELHFGAGDPASATFAYREEPMHVAGVIVTDRIASTSVSLGDVSLSVLGGQRSAPDENTGFASGSASIPLTGVVSLTVAGGKYPSNRLTGATGGRFFSTGFSFRFGGGRLPPAPQPSGVRGPLPEYTRFAIRASDAQKVELAGDWNSWTLVSATRASNGVWYVDLPLKAGEYRYAFLVDGKDWRVPEGVVAVDDGFGSKSAYVTVRTAESVMAKHNQEGNR